MLGSSLCLSGPISSSSSGSAPSSNAAVLWHGSYPCISYTGAVAACNEVEEKLVALPQLRSDDHVFTVLGAGNNWGGLPWLGRDFPGPSQTHGFRRAPHPRRVFLRMNRRVMLRRLEHCGKSKKCCVCLFPWMRGCDAQLSSAALRSLLPAARLLLSGKKSPEWIKHGRPAAGRKAWRRIYADLGLGAENLRAGSSKHCDIIWTYICTYIYLYDTYTYIRNVL